MAKVIFPPSPASSIPPNDLKYYDEFGIFCAQPKYNGSRCLVHIRPDGNVFFYSRHGRPHHGWTAPRVLHEEIMALPGLKLGTEYWLDGELLVKTKAEDTKNKLVLFDILHYDTYLFLGPKQVGRLFILNEICGKPEKLDPWRGMAYYISDNVLMAPTFFANFREEFDKFSCDEVEGIVLRKKESVLDKYGNSEYEASWLIRCRRPHKNYNF